VQARLEARNQPLGVRNVVHVKAAPGCCKMTTARALVKWLGAATARHYEDDASCRTFQLEVSRFASRSTAARTPAACLLSSAKCPAPDDLGPLGSDEPEDYIGPPPTSCKGPQGIDPQRATMVNYDEYLYPYWDRPKSKRPPGAPLPPPAPPPTNPRDDQAHAAEHP
jgi:hypothetical protein